ncbi:MAG: hypothetical protein EBU49_04130 [Proteobacteria bacterium]|nr:hypothetical protein [Pseudomonadota bacterium]
MNLLRDTLLTFVARAGKGKDEVLQILARETGSAIAALLKQPLADFASDLAKNHRLQVTLELVPKSKGSASRNEKSQKKPSGSGKRRSKTKSTTGTSV